MDELTDCPICFAAVRKARLDDHQGWHREKRKPGQPGSGKVVVM